jgi:ferritin
MIGKKMLDAINKQINAELYSAYLYLSMSADLDSKKLAGFASWMRAQAREETMHAMKMYGYLAEQGGRIIMYPIAGPKTEWGSPLEVFEETFKHEQNVTAMINNLVRIAKAEKDADSEKMLQWFVKEQVEEEESAEKVRRRLLKIKTINDLKVMDRLMGVRK